MAKQANDFLEELAQDSEYQQMIREKEAKRVAAEASYRREEAQLVQELQDSGTCVVVNRIPGQQYNGPPRSVWDLVNTTTRYPQAIPILVKHLQLPYSRAIQEGIVRALTTSEGRGIAFEPLVKLFRKISDGNSESKWLLGAAIAETATETDVQTIIELINDKGHGRGRAFLPLGLVHLQKEVALPILKQLTADPIMSESASKAISLLEAKMSQD